MPVISTEFFGRFCRHRSAQMDLAGIEVIHRRARRIREKHQLDETCECCEAINKSAETKGESEWIASTDS